MLHNNSANANLVDYEKFANVPDTVPVDYNALTAISDTDQYKVIGVQETVTVDDGDGNIKQSVEQKINVNVCITLYLFSFCKKYDHCYRNKYIQIIFICLNILILYRIMIKPRNWTIYYKVYVSSLTLFCLN